MRNYLYLFIFLLTCEICNSQNLVVNPSFEDTVACPTGFSTSTVDFITDAQGWMTSWNSSDYYNGCSTGQNSVPNNIAGHYPAATGQAYCGMFVAWDDGVQEYHENIVSQLSSPLVVGTKYYISFKTVCAGQSGSLWKKACNKIGITFSNSTWKGLDNFSPLFTNSIITDTVNWTVISGSFIADSAYNYVLVGSFFDRFHINIIDLDTVVGPGAYYFFDDICVSTDSLECNSKTVGINEAGKVNEVVLFPNPFTMKVNITSNTNELCEVILYDATLRKIFNHSFTNSISVNTEKFAKGIYFYEVKNKSGIIKKGKVAKD
jgi:hypothetical protein